MKPTKSEWKPKQTTSEWLLADDLRHQGEKITIQDKVITIPNLVKFPGDRSVLVWQNGSKNRYEDSGDEAGWFALSSRFSNAPTNFTRGVEGLMVTT